MRGLALVGWAVVAAGCGDPRPAPTVPELPNLIADPPVVVAAPGEPVTITVTNDGSLPVEVLESHVYVARDQVVDVDITPLPLVLEPDESMDLITQSDGANGVLVLLGWAPDVYLPSADGPLPRDVQVPILVAERPPADQAPAMVLEFSHAAHVEGEPAFLLAGLQTSGPTDCLDEDAFPPIQLEDAGPATLSQQIDSIQVPAPLQSAVIRGYLSCTDRRSREKSSMFSETGWRVTHGMRWAE